MAMTKTSTYQLPQRTQATTLESVKFTDGMVVTADDLEAAMNYPAAMLQTVLRSYFGCGLVCGLTMDAKTPIGQAGRSADHGSQQGNTFMLCIEPGLAVDCHGFPVELCNKVTMDLTPDPCADLSTDPIVCIAIRRVTSDEAPRDGCSCSTDVDDPRFQCSRTRNHSLVKAFWVDELEDLRSLCALPSSPGTGYPDDQPGKSTTRAADTPSPVPSPSPESLCECLTECPPCDLTAESWILLGCVRLGSDGLVPVDDTGGLVDVGRRRYVKPTRCACEHEARSQPDPEAIELANRVTRLEGILGTIAEQSSRRTGEPGSTP